MEKYTKPSVRKVKTINIELALKKANCGASNTRQMPNNTFKKTK